MTLVKVLNYMMTRPSIMIGRKVLLIGKLIKKMIKIIPSKLIFLLIITILILSLIQITIISRDANKTLLETKIKKSSSLHHDAKANDDIVPDANFGDANLRDANIADANIAQRDAEEEGQQQQMKKRKFNQDSLNSFASAEDAVTAHLMKSSFDPSADADVNRRDLHGDAYNDHSSSFPSVIQTLTTNSSFSPRGVQNKNWETPILASPADQLFNPEKGEEDESWKRINDFVGLKEGEKDGANKGEDNGSVAAEKNIKEKNGAKERNVMTSSTPKEEGNLDRTSNYRHMLSMLHLIMSSSANTIGDANTGDARSEDANPGNANIRDANTRDATKLRKKLKFISKLNTKQKINLLNSLIKDSIFDIEYDDVGNSTKKKNIGKESSNEDESSKEETDANELKRLNNFSNLIGFLVKNENKKEKDAASHVSVLSEKEKSSNIKSSRTFDEKVRNNMMKVPLVQSSFANTATTSNVRMKEKHEEEKTMITQDANKNDIDANIMKEDTSSNIEVPSIKGIKSGKISTTTITSARTFIEAKDKKGTRRREPSHGLNGQIEEEAEDRKREKEESQVVVGSSIGPKDVMDTSSSKRNGNNDATQKDEWTLKEEEKKRDEWKEEERRLREKDGKRGRQKGRQEEVVPKDVDSNHFQVSGFIKKKENTKNHIASSSASSFGIEKDSVVVRNGDATEANDEEGNAHLHPSSSSFLSSSPSSSSLRSSSNKILSFARDANIKDATTKDDDDDDARIINKTKVKQKISMNAFNETKVNGNDANHSVQQTTMMMFGENHDHGHVHAKEFSLNHETLDLFNDSLKSKEKELKDKQRRKLKDVATLSSMISPHYHPSHNVSISGHNVSIIGSNNTSLLSKKSLNNNEKELCPVTPPFLVGRMKINLNPNVGINMTNTIKINTNIKIGGSFEPKECSSRSHVAIIIPFRDRWNHLATLLYYLHPLLQRQQIKYKIYVIEQFGDDTFNKGVLMNAGVLESLKEDPNIQCFIFHDVDLIPEDDRNLYNCPQSSPRHMSPAIDKFNYTLPYDYLVGGVLAISKEHYYLVNGYSNLYWGWGGEDDDIAHRMSGKKLKILRPPNSVGRYKMIKHVHRKESPSNVRSALLRMAKRRASRDGISSVHYEVKGYVKTELFTKITVEIGHIHKWHFPSPNKLVLHF